MSPSTGSLMAALTQQGESGSAGGWSSTWKHQQLALTFTVADFCNVTQGGEIQNPAGNMAVHNGQLVVSTGQSPDLFMSATLPKGFRFTGYEIVVLNNLGGVRILDTSHSNCNMILFETDDLSRNVGTTQMVYNNANDYNYYTTIRDEIYANNPHYLAVARKEGKPNGDFRMAQQNEGNTEYVITRTSMAADGSDMSNHLYFRLAHASNVFFGVTIKSARFYFTAEGDFTEKVSPKAEPTSVTTTGVNYMYAPFTTGKLDLGDVSLDDNGHYTYKYYNVRDLEANNVIYESGAVTTAGALPATPGTGGIYGVYNDGKYYYGLKNNTTDAYYFVETPTMAPTSAGDGSESPVGFRITGAKVHYAYGVDATGGPEPIIGKYDEFTISYTYRGTTYYLGNGYGLSPTTNWFMDDNGRVRCGTNGENYLTIAYNYYYSAYLTTTTTPEEATKFKRNGGYLQVDGGDYNNYYVSYRSQNYPSSYWGLRSANNNQPVTASNTGTQAPITVGTVNVPAFTAKPYTLTVYQKDGTTIEETAYVGEAGTTVTIDGVEHQRVESGTVELTNLNNDAIKFKVEGLQGDDAKALITVELTMQSLDPYIDHMSVVVYDPQTNVGTEEDPQPLRLSQGFTASDFSVSGGVFDFYLPGVCAGHEVQITFEDLYSHYADESYTVAKDGFKGSADHFSRYNFVKSDHFNQFGTTTNNIYSNPSEAATPTYTRVKVGTVGTAPFKFNNAADVSAGRADYFIEYPFSLEAYAAEPNKGSFIEQKFTVSSTVQKKTSYVFTTDETAYNIAPTTATQHRVYAFYKMVTNVKTETYNPQVAFEKIYDKTLYVDSEGKTATDAFYRATVTAVGASGNVGYATTDDIFKIIDAAVKGTDASGTVKEGEGTQERTIGTYSGKDAKLTSAKQLLCLDFSNLKGVFQVTTEQHGSMDDYSGTNAANCLIFLPVNATAPNNNVAYKTPEGSFRAAHSIILTDKEPFYSPYDIQVDAANKVEYKRLITTDKYGKVQNASLILPFAIKVDDSGTHVNPDGSMFSLHTMQETASLQLIGGTTYAYFPGLSDVKTTEANKPYLVQLSENSSEDGVCFVVSQTGALIKATTDMGVDYTFTGETSTGTATAGEAQGDYTFVSKGTYSGAKIAKGENVFYFARNHFVNSANLNEGYTDVKIAPFRAYYASSTTGAKLASFDVIFGEGLGDIPTGLQAVEAANVVDMNAPVYDLQGRMVATSYRELTEKKVQRGLYVVNGVKIMIK